MPSSDTIVLWLSSAEKTALCGSCLVQSVYTLPLTIFLEGELGAGKTTFLQGFAAGLGIRDTVQSPTYALEQRYETPAGTPFIHCDLYRLSPQNAAETLSATDDHDGIRCVEWSERIVPAHHADAQIRASFREKDEGRELTLTFEDISIPTRENILTWRQEVALPDNVAAHCDMVAEVTAKITEYLLTQGTVVRPLAVRRAAEVHDLLRFLDFKQGSAGPGASSDTARTDALWESVKHTFPDMGHEEAAAAFLSQKGFPAIGEIVRTHGLLSGAGNQQLTTEQTILFYADKRVAHDRIVTLDERFAEFETRYGSSPHQPQWQQDAHKMERTLFPDGVPF